MTHPTPKDYKQQEKTPQQIERDTKTIVDSYTPKDWREETVQQIMREQKGSLTLEELKHNEGVIRTALDTERARIVEQVAEYLYNQMPYDEKGEKPKWVVGGNSFKQDEARDQAITILRKE